jgi:hypothetical protein
MSESADYSNYRKIASDEEGLLLLELRVLALVSFRMGRRISDRDYCTTKVSGKACFKTVDPEVKAPVTVKL